MMGCTIDMNPCLMRIQSYLGQVTESVQPEASNSVCLSYYVLSWTGLKATVFGSGIRVGVFLL